MAKFDSEIVDALINFACFCLITVSLIFRFGWLEGLALSSLVWLWWQKDY
jgi:hypothetical protein